MTVVVNVSTQTQEPSGKIEPFSPSEIFVSNEVREALEIAVDLCLSFIIANVGIVSNIIIIVVFAKQGYKESMNISMTAIAFWDLFKCLGGSMQRMTGPISLVSVVQAQSWRNITTAVMSYVLSFSTYVSSVLASYVALERCICVSMPLLVKTLLTPKVTFIAMSSLSVIVFGAFMAVFFIYDIIWVYNSQWNATIAVYKYSNFYYKNKDILMPYYNWSGVFWPLASFIVIVVCTAIIVIKLRQASEFRSKSKTDGDEALSPRDKQVIKMLIVVIGIYVANLFPRIAIYLAKDFVPELYFLKKYHNTFLILTYVTFCLDLSNATCNLYVFLSMSSNFRATALELIGRGGTK